MNFLKMLSAARKNPPRSAEGELPEHPRDGDAAPPPLHPALDGGRAGVGAGAGLRRRRVAGQNRGGTPLLRRSRHRAFPVQ